MAKRGIVSLGTYIPNTRLCRQAITNAYRWRQPDAGPGRGHRAVKAPDEDSLTMAVEATRRVLRDCDPDTVDALSYASTTAPFADRQNATLIAEATGLSANVSCLDVGGSLKSGLVALNRALASGERTLVSTADCREALPGSRDETAFGDAAAATITGHSDLLCEMVAMHSSNVDFVDHYRAAASSFDYSLEERWVRDAGMRQLVPDAIEAVLRAAGIDASCINHLAIAGCPTRESTRIAKQLECTNAEVTDDLHETCGFAGAAHPLLMLAGALENSEPGDLILLCAFGQGCESLLLRTTTKVQDYAAAGRFSRELKNYRKSEDYVRYVSQRGLLPVDWGMRAERDNRTAQAAFYRHRDTITGFTGGRCGTCGALQFPRGAYCANPECRARTTLKPVRMSDLPGSVKSYTEDWLAYSVNPPLCYGNVRFGDGAVVMMEMTDFFPGELALDLPVRMVFRIKDMDNRRGFRRYFWKAAPDGRAEEDQGSA